MKVGLGFRESTKGSAGHLGLQRSGSNYHPGEATGIWRRELWPLVQGCCHLHQLQRAEADEWIPQPRSPPTLQSPAGASH